MLVRSQLDEYDDSSWMMVYFLWRASAAAAAALAPRHRDNLLFICLCTYNSDEMLGVPLAIQLARRHNCKSIGECRLECKGVAREGAVEEGVAAAVVVRHGNVRDKSATRIELMHDGGRRIASVGARLTTTIAVGR